MSAQEYIRAQLNELMRTHQNEIIQNINQKESFKNVCKLFLFQCCPYEVFSGTRLNLGQCRDIHVVQLQRDYLAAQNRKDLGFEIIALNQLKSFIKQSDYYIEMTKRELTIKQNNIISVLVEQDNYIQKLDSEIDEKAAIAEQLGFQGLVEDSEKLADEVILLMKEKENAELLRNSTLTPQNYHQLSLRVCEVCNSYLCAHDNNQRLADHFGGKLHIGFAFLREKVVELENQVLKESTESPNIIHEEEVSAHDLRDDDFHPSTSRQQRYKSGHEDKENINNRNSYRSQSPLISNPYNYKSINHYQGKY